jgi:putative SOS response-associated peptidase YedK
LNCVTPVHFQLKDHSLFGFAGVWDVWQSSAGKEFTVAIVTTKPNVLTATVHDRMPVVLARNDEAVWLYQANHDTGLMLPVLKSYPASEMEAVQVNPALRAVYPVQRSARV